MPPAPSRWRWMRQTSRSGSETLCSVYTPLLWFPHLVERPSRSTFVHTIYLYVNNLRTLKNNTHAHRSTWTDHTLQRRQCHQLFVWPKSGATNCSTRVRWPHRYACGFQSESQGRFKSFIERKFLVSWLHQFIGSSLFSQDWVYDWTLCLHHAIVAGGHSHPHPHPHLMAETGSNVLEVNEQSPPQLKQTTVSDPLNIFHCLFAGLMTMLCI
jgi:hypothetical protein